MLDNLIKLKKDLEENKEKLKFENINNKIFALECAIDTITLLRGEI